MQNRYTKKNSYLKAVVLFSILIMAFVFYKNMNKDGIPSGLAGLINADFENYRNLSRFEEPEQKEIRNELAGFWEFSQGDPDTDPVSKTERLELIDNGIVWHVINWNINLPSGVQTTLTHGRHAFYTPFSFSHDTAQMYCEALIVRQILISGNDTCYGESQELQMWEIDMSDDKLYFNKRPFTRYEGELVNFFPDNRVLNLVDRIDLNPCVMETSLISLSKMILSENPGEVQKGKREGVLNSMIENYYRPLILEELIRNHDLKTIPDSLNLTLAVSESGAVTSVRNHSERLTAIRFNTALTNEIKSWAFPSSHSDEVFSYTLQVR